MKPTTRIQLGRPPCDLADLADLADYAREAARTGVWSSR